MNPQDIFNLELLEVVETRIQFIMRVPGGWIFTDKRGSNAVGTFVPFNIEFKEL